MFAASSPLQSPSLHTHRKHIEMQTVNHDTATGTDAVTDTVAEAVNPVTLAPSAPLVGTITAHTFPVSAQWAREEIEQDLAEAASTGVWPTLDHDNSEYQNSEEYSPLRAAAEKALYRHCRKTAAQNIARALAAEQNEATGRDAGMTAVHEYITQLGGFPVPVTLSGLPGAYLYAMPIDHPTNPPHAFYLPGLNLVNLRFRPGHAVADITAMLTEIEANGGQPIPFTVQGQTVNKVHWQLRLPDYPTGTGTVQILAYGPESKEESGE
jgi:hypothetical protein